MFSRITQIFAKRSSRVNQYLHNIKGITKHFMNTSTQLPEIVKHYLESLNIEHPQNQISFLSSLQRKHIGTFSFNNLDVLLDKELPLEMTDLSEKILTHNRGGYCFEHNKLFFAILKALGYEVSIALGKVTPELQSDGPRTHRITLLKHEGKEYIVDVGFGPRNPVGLIPFVIEDTIEQHGWSYRIVQNDRGEYVLQSKKGSDPYVCLYTFDRGHYTEGDCEAGHFYSRQHPKASFPNRLMVSLVQEEQVLAIYNRTYRIRRGNGHSEDIPIESLGQFCSILEEDFAVQLSQEEAQYIWKKALAF